MTKIISLYLFCCFLFFACNKAKSEKMTSDNFKYAVTVTAPTEYPVEVHIGYLSDDNKNLICGIPKAGVKYSSEKEIEILIKELDLSRIKKLFPLTEYNVKFYAHGKLIRFISKSSEDNANKYLFRFTVPPLMEGKQDGESALNYLFYLPKGITELEIF